MTLRDGQLLFIMCSRLIDMVVVLVLAKRGRPHQERNSNIQADYKIDLTLFSLKCNL